MEGPQKMNCLRQPSVAAPLAGRFWRAAILLLIVDSTLCAAAPHDITVDPGGFGNFTTIAAAIGSIPKENADLVRINIKPGTYTEHLIVDRPNIALVGAGSKPDETTITYNLSAVSPKEGGTGNVGTSASSSVVIHTHDVLASNLTFANSTPHHVAQAVAVKTLGDRIIFNNCRFLGFQDTLYPTGGRQYFKDCYVEGSVDFIFGNATAVFDQCMIHTNEPGYVTAANTEPATNVGFVFLDCTLTGASELKPGSIFLGRPWQWDRNKTASVTYVRTKMGPHIASKGWNAWDEKKNTDPGKTTRYAEFGSMDLDGKPLDVSGRVNWAKQLTADEAMKFNVQEILGGSDHWDPVSQIQAIK
jgi:pectinesterase